MDPSDFRVAFPEFQDVTKYTDETIQFWLDVSTLLVNPVRWGPLTNLGIQLATAHAIVLGAKDAAGGIPGGINGPVASKSIDKVSVSYNSAVIAFEGGGAWNMTSYGIRYLTFANMMGAGAMQL